MLHPSTYHVPCQVNRRCKIRPFTVTVAFFSGILVCCPAFAASEACTLIAQTQVSAALEIPVNPGTPISSPSTCQWIGKGRFATLTIMQPLAGKSPIDRFNAGKTSKMPGITMEPVSGVGDEAYYVYFSGTTRALGLVVKKGSSAFEIRVYGFEIDKAKSVAKTMCQTVAGKI
jgi:hypothetical protein